MFPVGGLDCSAPPRLSRPSTQVAETFLPSVSFHFFSGLPPIGIAGYIWIFVSCLHLYQMCVCVCVCGFYVLVKVTGDLSCPVCVCVCVLSRWSWLTWLCLASHVRGSSDLFCWCVLLFTQKLHRLSHLTHWSQWDKPKAKLRFHAVERLLE